MSKKHENNEDEEIVFEPGAISSDKDDEEEFEIEDDGATDKDKIKKLRDQLKDSQKKSAENMDGWQRALADYANLKKDSAEQVKELKGYVLESFIEELFPVLDSFDMAMKNKETWESVNENWRKGIEYIYVQLTGILGSNQVEPIGAPGEKFNPDLHVAIEEVETDDEKKDGTVSEVVQKGYKGPRGVIRPAKVKIYKHKA
jgi:molecular chaperone GrpE